MIRNLTGKIVALILVTIFTFSNITLTTSALINENFSTFTIYDGLSQGTVEAMIQDSKGYIWFGTNDGLNRYNGYSTTVFRNEKNNPNSLSDNYITTLEEDKEGNVWVGTINGLNKLTDSGRDITTYLTQDRKGNLLNSTIGDILIRENGDILVGTDQGLNLYDKLTDSFKKISTGILLDVVINALDEDDEGNIWIGTEGNGLIKFNIDTNAIEFFTSKDASNSDEVSNYIVGNKIYDVFCDKDGIVWVGTYDTGASRINTKTGEITNYNEDSWGIEDFSGKTIRDFFRDSNDILWIASNDGLIKYENDEFYVIQHNPYDNRSLVNDMVFSIIEEKSGLLMLGTYAGVSFFDPTNTIHHYKQDPRDPSTLNSNMVQGLYEDDIGNIWVGTSSNGINILDPNKTRIEVFDRTKNLSSNRVNDIVGYKDLVFIGTDIGLNVVDKKNETLKIYREAQGLVNDNIKNLYLDDKNYLWIGTARGFCIFNIETQEFINLNQYIEPLTKDYVYSGAIFQDSKGVYWLGGFLNEGLIKIDPERKKINLYTNDINNPSSIVSNCIRSIAEDSKGNIWIGSSDGLSSYNSQEDNFRNYTTEDGLPNNTIYGILIDKDDNPWVSTNLGISKYIVSRDKFLNLNISDGLQNYEFNGESYLELKSGEFLFGGVSGLNAFRPEDINISEYVPNIVFDDFYVNGNKLESINGELLSYNENNIRIQVFLPDYKNAQSVKYFYNLTNNDDKWIKLDSNEIAFSSLSPGTYNLRVKAINSRGFVSSESSLNFTVKPHFLLSFPALIMYILIVVALVKRQSSKVRKLDLLVDARTEELRSEMEKNNELFAKVLKLEVNKNSYFINLSHELRTPLNVLHTTEQLISKLNSDRKIEVEKLDYYLSVIRRNNKRLLNLINNLIDISKIEHGKYHITKRNVDIVYLVEETALGLRDYVEEKGISLLIDPEMEEKIISCDGDDIERCVVNLISNATKFTPKGGQIIVTLEDLNDFVRISVEDTGIGIPEEYLEFIFNRFNQVVDEQSEIKGGSGLGLTITKQIIDLHKGRIYVESKVGEGSTFIIELPVE